MEHRLMQIRIKHVPRRRRVEALKPMTLQRGHQNRFRHLQALVQAHEVRVQRIHDRLRRRTLIAVTATAAAAAAVARRRRRGQLCRRHRQQRVLEVVDGRDQVFAEFLQREVPCGLGLAFCALLQVAVVGDGAEVFVLRAARGWVLAGAR